MARLTYATLALALASLVSGFFVRSTAVPLFASIGLSALVLLLILRGWARRIRQDAGSDSEPEPVEDLEDLDDLDLDDIVLVDPDDVSEELPSIKPKAARDSRPPREPREPRVAREPRGRPRIEREAPKRGPRAGGGRVVVLPGRTRYHIAGCRFAHGKGAEEISEAAARRRRFQPCSVCLGT